MMKRRSKTKDSKRSILNKKVRRDHPDILLQKALRGRGDPTTWPSNITNSVKRKRAKSKKNTQKNIQNTKRLTELGRMNKNNDYQT